MGRWITRNLLASSQASDNELVSGWSEYQVTMTRIRNKQLPNTFFMRLFERYPNAFPLLRRIHSLSDLYMEIREEYENVK